MEIKNNYNGFDIDLNIIKNACDYCLFKDIGKDKCYNCIVSNEILTIPSNFQPDYTKATNKLIMNYFMLLQNYSKMLSVLGLHIKEEEND